MKIDKTVLKETKYIAVLVAILSVLMQAVFLIIGKWSIEVLLGNIWGGAVGVANFFGMGLGVQKAVLQDEKAARQTLKTSQTVRFLGIFILMAVGVSIPIFNVIAVVLPLVFPSIAIMLKPLIDKNAKNEDNS